MSLSLGKGSEGEICLQGPGSHPKFPALLLPPQESPGPRVELTASQTPARSALLGGCQWPVTPIPSRV